MFEVGDNMCIDKVATIYSLREKWKDSPANGNILHIIQLM